MGNFSHRVEVSGMDGQRFEAVEALVDTGSSYTVIPASLLRGLGIAPQERIEFELSDGRIISEISARRGPVLMAGALSP